MTVGDFVADVMDQLKEFQLAGDKIDFVLHVSASPELFHGNREFKASMGGDSEVRFSILRGPKNTIEEALFNGL